ncbi:MAG: M1 family aminopeptidase [Candidatus Aminicenantaceae bacterium]
MVEKRKCGFIVIFALILFSALLSLKAAPFKNGFKITDFYLNIEIIPERYQLEGEAKLRICSEVQEIESFQFYIRPSLKIKSIKDEKSNSLVFSQSRVKRIFPNSETSLVKVNLDQKLFIEEEIEITISYGGTFFMSSDFNLDERRYNRAFSSITKEAAWLRPVQLWYPYIADKYMSATIRAKVPSGWTVITNGKPKEVVEEGGKTVFVNKENKTSSLDITLFAAPYVSESKTVHDFHITAYFFPHHKNLIDSYLEKTGEVLNFYTQNFGKPNAEKFSIIEIGTGYGTGTSAPFGYAISSHLINNEFPLIPHEIAHLWWGETISDNLGEDTWLHEGLATFSDYYFRIEKAPDRESQRRILFDLLNRAIPIGNPSTLSILEGGAKHAPEGFLVYERAAYMIHALRHILGDKLFFKALRRYIEKYRGRKADTAGFIRVFNSEAGKDLSWFFDYYLRRRRPPRYRVIFRNFVGYGIGTLHQDYVPRDFSMPVTLELISNLRSFRRVVKVKGRSRKFIFSLKSNEVVMKIKVDPDFDILGVRDDLEDRWEARSLRLEAQEKKIFKHIKPRLFALWEKYPDNVYILHEVAQFYYAQNKWEKGIKIYKRILSLEPNEYEFIALANIAGAYETVGDREKQKLYLEKALAKGSSMYSITRSLMDKLEKLKDSD